MNRLTIACIWFFAIMCLVYCDKPTQKSIRTTGPDSVFMAMKAEAEQYLTAVKKMKTEYEVNKYVDEQTVYMRRDRVKECGSEENWKTKLAWLEQNGAQIVGYFNNEGPMFNRAPGEAPFEKPLVK